VPKLRNYRIVMHIKISVKSST